MGNMGINYKNISVLFIDDNALNREITKKMLEDEGIKVYLAEDGYKGLEILKAENSINFVLLDVHMPKIDGFQTAEKIRENFGERYTILMFTSVDIRDSIKKIKEIGVADYLIKPVRRNELLNKIRETLNNDIAYKIESDLAELEKEIIKVLVAEDNQINMDLLIKIIKRCGNYKVIGAKDGKEAVEIYKIEKPKYIFMDIQMPEMNGFEAMEEIRKIENNSKQERTKIIAVTAYAAGEDREKCINMGMDDYISKPFKIEDIRGVLN